MKVKVLSTGKEEEYNASYCARLIEQGKAIAVKEAPEAEKKPAAAAKKG